MKKTEETVTRTYRETVTKYVATDGTAFKTEEECKKYEESALCTVKTRLIGKTLFPIHAGWKEKKTAGLYFGMDALFPCQEDNNFYFFKPETEEDIKNFLQFAKLEGTDLDYKNDNTFKERYGKEDFKDFRDTLINGTDDPDTWDNFRIWVAPKEIEKGKTYIYISSSYDDWGTIHEVERYKEVVNNILTDWTKWLDSQLEK